MLKKPGLILFFSSSLVLGLLLYRAEADIEWVDNLLISYRSSIISPLEYISLITLLVALYLLLFNQTIQQAWWLWARFALLVPFALIILLLPMYQNGGGFITFGGTTELVILWGVVFAAATFVTALYHRFYLKTGVTNAN
jgi:hypothetical protein